MCGTWVDLVREYFPDIAAEDAEYLLWEKTCFPLGSLEQVKQQLAELKERKVTP
jgi:hypothetical protein